MIIISSSTSSLIFLLIILRCHLLNGCFGRWTSIGLFHACLHEPLLYISACFILPNIECFIQPPNPSITIIIMYLFKTPSYIFDLRQILNISLNPHSIHPLFLLSYYSFMAFPISKLIGQHLDFISSSIVSSASSLISLSVLYCPRCGIPRLRCWFMMQ